MAVIEKEILDKYGSKLRIRVCGIWVEGDKILMVKHRGIGKNGILWAPPGGGMEFGEDAKTALQREFLEEAGLDIQVSDFLFVYEFQEGPFHAIELFFKVTGNASDVKTGFDPEMANDNQIIMEVGFIPLDSKKLVNQEDLHFMLRQIKHPNEIFNLKGYFKFH